MALQASVEVYRFVANDRPYAEVFFYILGNTLPDSLGNRSVEILYHFTDENGSAIGDKYNLNISTEQSGSDFMDLRRHYLKPGAYRFNATIKDLNSRSDVLAFSEEITIPDAPSSARLSDLQLLASADPTTNRDKWFKKGRTCIPLPLRYCHEELTELFVYTELYKSDTSLNKDFYVKCSILADTLEGAEPVLVTHKRYSPAPVVPVLIGFDMAPLCTGMYQMLVEVFSKENIRVAHSSTSFYRSNPDADTLLIREFEKYFAHSFTHGMTDDSVRYALRALTSVVSPIEVQVVNDLVKRAEPDMQRRFIHRYWVERSPSSPEKAYREFMEVATTVDVLFHSGLGYGFETDRGRIFMRYGAPDDQIAVEDEPSAPPYEIWIYYDFPVTSQSNVKFLFYDPSLSNQFELLHSTAVGEVQNPSWEQMLYRSAVSETQGGDFIDSRPVAENWHRNARKYFTDY